MDNNAKPKPLPGMEAFLTGERANLGHKLPLTLPTGEATGHWIQCRSVDSEAFTKARTVQSRRTAELGRLETEEQQDAAFNEIAVMLTVALVADWSFAHAEFMEPEGREVMPCTPDNVAAFLRQAPQICKQLEKFASNAKAFYGRTSED